jgi:hypothetical protein
MPRWFYSYHFLTGAQIPYRDAGAIRHATCGDRQADALGAAGNHDYLAVQIHPAPRFQSM